MSVRRNDEFTVEEVEGLAPERIVLSPGSGAPAGAGVCVALAQRWAGRVPLLGIGLGLHCLAVAFGGGTVAAQAPAIGESSLIYHNGKGVFHGLPFSLRGRPLPHPGSGPHLAPAEP